MLSRERYSRDGGVELVSFKPQTGLGNYKTIVQGPKPFNVEPFRSLKEMYTPNTVKGQSRRWKDFQHYKLVGSLASGETLHPTVSYTEHGGYSGAWYYLGTHADIAFGLRGHGSLDNPDVSWLPNYLDTQAGPGEDFIPDPESLDSLLNAGVRACMVGIKSDMSLINSIIELKDFKSTVRGAANAKAVLTRASKGLEKWLHKPWSKASVSQLVRASAQANLQYNFAWAPLVSDICNFFVAVRSWHKRLTALLRNAETPRTRHWAYVLSDDKYAIKEYGPYPLYSLPYMGNTDPPVSGVHTSKMESYPLESKFCVTCQYSYKFTDFQLAHARVLSFLDALGVNLNPAIVWNALPWSFLIDWVVGISPLLDSVKKGNMEPVINIRNFCWSVSRKRMIQTRCQVGQNDFGFLYSAERPVYNLVESAYKRKIGFPPVASIVGSGLSLKEFSLGASLLTNIRQWRPRRRVRV